MIRILNPRKLLFTAIAAVLVLPSFIHPDHKVPLGKFAFQGGKGKYFSLTLFADSTFEQHNGDCTWDYTAKGKWTVHSDTIRLKAKLIYKTMGGKKPGKKTLVRDTTSYEYSQFYKFNLVTIASMDTIVQLWKFSGGYKEIKLGRVILVENAQTNLQYKIDGKYIYNTLACNYEKYITIKYVLNLNKDSTFTFRKNRKKLTGNWKITGNSIFLYNQEGKAVFHFDVKGKELIQVYDISNEYSISGNLKKK